MSYITHPDTHTIFLPYTSVCRWCVLILFLPRLFSPNNLVASGSLINWFHILLVSPLDATSHVNPTVRDFNRVILIFNERQIFRHPYSAKVKYSSCAWYFFCFTLAQNTDSESWYTASDRISHPLIFTRFIEILGEFQSQKFLFISNARFIVTFM